MLCGERSSLVNSPASEVTCLRMYSIWKAYENVHGLTDWQRPRNQQGGKWRSKVNWNLAQEYFQVDLMNKHMSGLGEQKAEES